MKATNCGWNTQIHCSTHASSLHQLPPSLVKETKEHQRELTMTIYLRFLSINEAAGVVKLSQSKKKKKKKHQGREVGHSTLKKEHKGSWRSHEILVGSEVAIWIVEEVWMHLVRFRSPNLDLQCKGYGLQKVLASLKKNQELSNNKSPYLQTMHIL